MAIEKKSKTSVDWTIEACDTVGYRGTQAADGSPGKRNNTALQGAYAGSPIYSAYVKADVGNKYPDSAGSAGQISYLPTANGSALKDWFMKHVVNGVVASNPNLGLNNQSMEYAGNNDTDGAPNLNAMDVGKGEGKTNVLNPFVPNLKSPGEGNWTDGDSQPAYSADGTDKPADLRYRKRR